MQEQMGNVNRAMETLKGISELEDMSSLKRNAKRKNDFLKWNRISRNCGTSTKGRTNVKWKY